MPGPAVAHHFCVHRSQLCPGFGVFACSISLSWVRQVENKKDHHNKSHGLQTRSSLPDIKYMDVLHGIISHAFRSKFSSMLRRIYAPPDPVIRGCSLAATNTFVTLVVHRFFFYHFPGRRYHGNKDRLFPVAAYRSCAISPAGIKTLA